MSGFHDAALQFLHSYGYLALFVLLTLETAMILHFIPSEVMVTAAASALATNRTGLALVILVSTLGATAGSLLLYAFSRFGGGRFLESHPHFFGLTSERRARMDAWFQRPAGESLVFFLRLLPFLRAAVSIPAGLARMDARKFALYSAAGSGLFNGALAYSAYAVSTNPDVMAHVRVMTDYAISRWPFFLALGAIAALAAWLLYRRRRIYRRAPELAVRHVVRTAATAALGAGAVLIGLSLMAPKATFRAVTWVAVDVGQAMQQRGGSPLLFLLSCALAAITFGLIGLTVSPTLERCGRRVVERFRSRGKQPRIDS